MGAPWDEARLSGHWRKGCMHMESKVKKVARNTAMGIINNIALGVLTLIARKMFLTYIGIEYLSIGQVINNILSILAFSELGVSNSVLYMLYKPVSEGDTEKIAKIIGTYKKVNRAIGCAIMALGCACMPFLGQFIHTSIPAHTVSLVFALNLLYSASTYFCSYRQILINANQANYIISEISLAVNVISIAVQCMVIYLTHNYIAYLIIMIAMGMCQNLLVYAKAGKMFPYLREYRDYRLGKAESKELLENVKAMFSVKFCGIVINNTDNVLVSVINTLMVGYCANYTIISTALRGLISIFHNSIVYSLGIASVKSSPQEKYWIFQRFLLINTGIAGITTLLLGVLWDDFIVIWLGKPFLIPAFVMHAILLNFYWTILSAGIWIFRDTNGLFIHVKRMLMLNALLNLVVSVALGKWIGVAGVYFATILADIVTDFWYDAKLVYTTLFGRPHARGYLAYVILNVALTWALVIGLRFALQPMPITAWSFVAKGLIGAAVYLCVFLLIYGRTSAFRDIYRIYLMPVWKGRKR